MGSVPQHVNGDSMVTTLYLVRHGETEGSEVKRYKGSINVPLSEKGIEQMEQVAKYLNRSYKSYKTYNGLKAVYCSPLIRALKSAEIVAEPFHLSPVIVNDLRERSFASRIPGTPYLFRESTKGNKFLV
jgi:broad specificity phosphatase PhoE